MPNYQLSAAGSEPAAFCKLFRNCNFKPKMKRKPAYFSDFIKCKNADLILLTNSWNIVTWLRRLGGRICLLCEDVPEKYDLAFCWEKEVWILYFHDFFDKALKLAHTIQRNGAKKTTLIRIDIKDLQEIRYDRK